MVCMHNWNSIFLNNNELHCVYFDVSKAYDTVSHSKLFLPIISV